MAVDITLDRLKAAVIKLAELTGENRFVLIGRLLWQLQRRHHFKNLPVRMILICGLKAMRMPLWTFAFNKWVREVHSISKTDSMLSG